MKRAFVVGATGYTGREVVRILRARGREVTAHVRPDSSRLSHWQQTWAPLEVDVDTTAWDEAAMAETLRRVQPRVIFALLGTTRERAKREQIQGDIYEAVDYGLTSLLIRATVAAGGHPRFLYLSSLGVTRKRPGNAYMLARWKIESELRDSPLPWVVARPAMITGDREEDRPGERIGGKVADGLLKVVGAFGGKRLAAKYRSQTGAQLATSLVRLAYDPAAANRAFDNDALQGA